MNPQTTVNPVCTTNTEQVFFSKKNAVLGHDNTKLEAPAGMNLPLVQTLCTRGNTRDARKDRHPEALLPQRQCPPGGIQHSMLHQLPPPPETNTKQHTIKLFLRYVSDFPCSIEPSRVLKEVGYTCMSTSEHLGALMDVLDKYFYRSPFALTQQRSIATAIKEKQINILHTYQCKPAQQLNTLFQGHTLANNYVPPFLP